MKVKNKSTVILYFSKTRLEELQLTYENYLNHIDKTLRNYKLYP